MSLTVEDNIGAFLHFIAIPDGNELRQYISNEGGKTTDEGPIVIVAKSHSISSFSLPDRIGTCGCSAWHFKLIFCLRGNSKV